MFRSLSTVVLTENPLEISIDVIEWEDPNSVGKNLSAAGIHLTVYLKCEDPVIES